MTIRLDPVRAFRPGRRQRQIDEPDRLPLGLSLAHRDDRVVVAEIEALHGHGDTETHRLAPSVAVGSAWGAFGPFFEAINGGSNDARIVLGPAPTWIAAPHITEEDTRRKERDPRKHAREYASVFQASASNVFELDDVTAAFAHPRPRGLRMRTQGVIDSASGGKDSFTFGGVRWVVPSRGETWRPYLELVFADEVPAKVMREDGTGAVIARIVEKFREHKIATVHGDQRDAHYIRTELDERGFTFHQHAWTAQSKPPAVERVRKWFMERSIALPAEPAKLKAEVLSFEEKISPSGQFTFSARGNGHDDYVALLVSAAMANLEGQLVFEELDMDVMAIRRPAAIQRGDTRPDPWLRNQIRARYNT